MTIRSRIQRAFFTWLDEARPRLKQNISILLRTDRHVEFAFPSATDALRGSLNRSGLVVAVEYEATCWDLLVAYDAVPKKVADGHICKLCLPDSQTVFASREDLWRDHLFDPLLRWINEELATATGLALFEGKGYTRAGLVRAPVTDPDVFKIIELGRRQLCARPFGCWLYPGWIFNERKEQQPCRI